MRDDSTRSCVSWPSAEGRKCARVHFQTLSFSFPINYIPGMPFPIPRPFPVRLFVALPIPILLPIRSLLLFPFPNLCPLPFPVPIALLIRFPFPVIYPSLVPIPMAFPFYFSVRLMILFMVPCMLTIPFPTVFAIPCPIKMFPFPTPHRSPFLLPLMISPLPLSVSDSYFLSVFVSVYDYISIPGSSSESISDSVSVSHASSDSIPILIPLVFPVPLHSVSDSSTDSVSASDSSYNSVPVSVADSSCHPFPIPIRFLLPSSFSVTQCAVEPVWYLPEIARRFGVDEVQLREALFKETNMMYPELVTRGDLKVRIEKLYIYMWWLLWLKAVISLSAPFVVFAFFSVSHLYAVALTISTIGSHIRLFSRPHYESLLMFLLFWLVLLLLTVIGRCY